MAQPSAPPSYDDAINNKQEPGALSSGFSPTQAAPYPSQNDFGFKPVDQQSAYPNSNPQQFDTGSSGYINPNFSGTTTFAATATTQPTFSPAPVSAEPVVVESEGFTSRGTFEDKSVRRVFIRKVFITLSLQLLVTFGIVCIFYFINDVRFFVQRTPAVYYAAYGVFLVFYLVLVCSTSAARKHPANIIMLSLLTLALSYMVGTIASFYDVQAVVIGMGVTVVVCVSVILFSIQTKFDFTKCGGLLFILLFVLIMFGFITIFTWYRPWYIQVVYGCLGALVFTLFLAFDTQLVMGGRKYELDPEEYIFGSLILYIDIVYIFLFILAIFGGSSK